MKNEKGITLVEVMSCLVVLSVLAGIATPTVENLKSKLTFRSEISRLVGELHKARLYAINNNTYVVFKYTANGYMTFIDDGRSGGTKEDWMHQPGEQILSDVTFGDRLTISIPDSSFSAHRAQFSGKSNLFGGSVVLQSSDGNKSKVIVNSIGRVRVEKL